MQPPQPHAPPVALLENAIVQLDRASRSVQQEEARFWSDPGELNKIALFAAMANETDWLARVERLRRKQP